MFKGIKVRGSYATKRSWSTVPNLKEKNINHPSPKKVSEVTRILENISDEDQVVLDCFAGSGTTGLACKLLKRKCILIEREQKFCDVIIERLRQDYLF